MSHVVLPHVRSPLAIVALHGFAQRPEGRGGYLDFLSMTRLAPACDARQVRLICPTPRLWRDWRRSDATAIADLCRREAESRRVVLAGFSDGGTMAVRVGRYLEEPPPLAGIVCHSGLWPERDLPTSEDLPALWIASEGDRWGEQTRDMGTRLPGDVYTQQDGPWPGGQRERMHWWSPRTSTRVVEWSCRLVAEECRR